MNKEQFKVGDKVYCPKFGNKIYTLTSTTSTSRAFPLEITASNARESFTVYGKIYKEDVLPSIFKVTKKNHELLSKLYGIQFEEPKSFLDHHLSLGSKVLCLIVKEPKELPEKIWEIEDAKDMAITIISKKDRDAYYSEKGLIVIPEYIFPIAIDSKGNIEYLSL